MQTDTKKKTAAAGQAQLMMTEWPIMALLTDYWRMSHGFPARSPHSIYHDGDMFERTVTDTEFIITIRRNIAATQNADVERDKLERDLAAATRRVRGAEAAIKAPDGANARNKQGHKDALAEMARVVDLLAALPKRGQVEVETVSYPLSVFGMKGL